jgi:hypothetical protein
VLDAARLMLHMWYQDFKLQVENLQS